MEFKKKHNEQQGSSGELKKITTTLDSLPAGNPNDTKVINKKQPLPTGVTSKMLYSDVIRIGWPALVELMLMQLASMADQMMVGRLGAWATSAVGLTMQPKMLLSTAFMALNTGAMALVGRYRGAGDEKRANLVLRQAFMLNAFFGILFSVIGTIFSRQMVEFMGATEELVLVEATKYLQIQMIGIFTISMTSCVTSCLRGCGDSKTAMIYNTISNGVNVVFNYLLIYGKFGFPRLEVVGASIATVLGQVIAFFMAMYAIRRKNQFIRLTFPKGWFKLDMPTVKNITKIGLPSMVEQLAMRFGVIVFTRTVTGLGTMLYATHQICMNIQALTFMNGQAFATSATSLVSQSLGKGRPDMAHHYAKRTQHIGTTVAILIAVFVFFFNKFVIGLYTPEAEIIAVGSTILSMVAIIQPFQSAQFILAGALRGAGDTKYTALVTMLTVMLLRPGLAILLVNHFNLSLHGAWYALVVDQLVRTALVVARFASGKWVTSFKPAESEF